MRLKDKVAIITGAAAGIGEASSRLFAAEGATVVALDLDSAGLDRLVGEIRDQGFACHGLCVDVTSSSRCREAVQWTARELGRIDILFNNAGFVHQGTLLEATEEDWDQALDLNVKSMFRTCRHALPVMLRQGSGNIINTASVRRPFRSRETRRLLGLQSGRRGLDQEPGHRLRQRRDSRQLHLSGDGGHAFPTVADQHCGGPGAGQEGLHRPPALGPPSANPRRSRRWPSTWPPTIPSS